MSFSEQAFATRLAALSNTQQSIQSSFVIVYSLIGQHCQHGLISIEGMQSGL